MSTRRRQRLSLRVLKAVSSLTRMKILNLLFDVGDLSYTELMKLLRLNPSRDAGRFAYHLKLLLKADLIEPDVKSKKYRLTDLGKRLVDVADDIEKQASKRKKMLVRTSNLSIEEFDRNKIADSLVREADVERDLALKIARETERKLLEFKTKHLTASLIREIVNTVLIEKGLEEYRHKMTRLGVPIYDMTQLIKHFGTTSKGIQIIHKAAGDAVIEEYTLLSSLPRDLADAHLSGAIHISDLGSWILKPNEFMHDLRFFLRKGLKVGGIDFPSPSYPPPKSFESALIAASSILRISSTEIAGEQTIDYFNVFLAPLIKGIPPDELKESLNLFLINLNQSLSEENLPIKTSIGLEIVIPKHLKEKEAIGTKGKVVGTYEDFSEESRLIASLLFEILSENKRKPFFNPSLIIKMRPEAQGHKESDDIINLVHRLAARDGTPYFSNLFQENQYFASYAATGSRFSVDWTEDWELDTLQTGNIGGVFMNLPRISYEAEGEERRFFELLDNLVDISVRTLKIKDSAIKQYAKEGLLPFLTQEDRGNRYFRYENINRQLSFIGLNEAIESLSGEKIYEEESLKLTEKVLKHLLQNTQQHSKRPKNRLTLSSSPNALAAKRLAELDVEKYGRARTHTQGTKENPFYTDMVAVPLETNIPLRKRLDVEERIHRLTPGGHLAIIQISDSIQDPEDLISTTKQIVEKRQIGLYAYSRNLTYCNECQNSFKKILLKCPVCGTINRLASFSRMSAKYMPLTHWLPTKTLALKKRVSYTIMKGRD